MQPPLDPKTFCKWDRNCFAEECDKYHPSQPGGKSPVFLTNKEREQMPIHFSKPKQHPKQQIVEKPKMVAV
jgi:hypothetical protein